MSDGHRHTSRNRPVSDLVEKRGSTFRIKLQLSDAAGTNVSSPSIAFHARSVTQGSPNVDGQADTTGNANRDEDFRYDARLAGYIFNLSTKALLTGIYQLNFMVGSDATMYAVPLRSSGRIALRGPGRPIVTRRLATHFDTQAAWSHPRRLQGPCDWVQ